MFSFVKYKWFSLVYMLGFITLFKAQNIDSLKTIAVKAGHDTSRITALLLLSDICSTEDILKYAEPALKLAEQNLKKTTNSTSLHKFYLKSRAAALTNLGYYCEQYTDFSKSLTLHKQALLIYEELKDSLNIANTLVGIGNAQLNLKSTRLALNYYQSALHICEMINDSLVLPPLLNNIATVYNNEGRLAFALNYMHRSLKVYKANNDMGGVGRQLEALSLVYQKQGDYEKAQQYNFEALKITEGVKPKDQFLIARILHNIAHTYVSSGNWKKAEPFFNRSLIISEKLNYKYSVSFCYTGLAKIYLLQGKQDRALDYFRRGLKINEEIGNKLGICVSLHNICDFYLKTGKHSMALSYGIKSLSVAEELNYPGKISTCAKLLYQIYKLQHNSALALAMYELHIANRDSVNSQDARKAAVAAQLQYEFDKKEAILKAEQDKAILKFEKKRMELEASIERKKFLILIGFTSTVLIAAILLLIILRNRGRKKQKQIQFEKSVLELEQQALRAQMNPHFIFNAINSIQSYILKRKKQEAYDYLAKFSRLIRIVLNNSQEKDLLLTQELEMIELYVELEQLRFDGFEFNLSVSERVNQFEIVVPSMLIQPYVENAICHGLMNLENVRNGILNVEVTQISSVLKVVIEDNGVGREKARLYKTADTHKSLGMAFTEQRLHVINKMQQYEQAKVVITDLYDSNGESVGTKVEIFIPINGK